MKSSHVEFASCLLNRPPTPTTSSSYRHNSPADSSCQLQSENSKNVDLSWLPNYNDNAFVSKSDHDSDHHNGQHDFDDSWLPDTRRNTSKTPSKSTPSRKPENDSWLPPTHKNKGQNDNNDTKRNASTTPSKPTTKSNHSWLPPTNIVKIGNKNKGEISSNKHKKSSSRNHDRWGSREVSPSKSEFSVETNSLGGVSTLLRRWKDLAVADTRSCNRKPKNSSGSKTASASPLRGASMKTNHPQESPPKVFDRRTSPSRPLSRQTCTSTKDSKPMNAEKEKIRVLDIIKKLSKEEELVASQAAANANESLSPRFCKTSDHQQVAGENKCFSPVIGSPRLIRGRQAFKDFLILMEHDKQRELQSLARRKPVSNFPYRGRIKAVLRVTFIRLGIEPITQAKSHRRSVSESMKSNLHHILDPRDLFSTGVKQGAAASRKKNDNGEARESHASPVSEVEVNLTTNSQELQSTTTSNQSVGCNLVREVEGNGITTTTTKGQELDSIAASNQSAEDHHQITELSIPSKEVMDKAQDIDSSSHSIQSKEDTQVPNREDCQEKVGQFLSAKVFSDDKGLDDGIQLQSDDPSHRQALENCHHWISEYSQPESDYWDEEESMQLFNVYDDWISDIARPRSVWEDMRQARYQEMLHLYSYNRDILELLERRSVSSFLSSGLRDKIDQLMVSRAQGHSHPAICSKVGKQEVAGRDSSREEAMEVEEEGKYEEEDDDDSMVDEDEDGGSRIKKQCSGCNKFIDQTACSSPPAQSPAPEERSWSHHNAIYDSDQVASPSLWPNPYLQNNTPHPSAFINQPSIEMELINVLRGHLVQLQQEMMELRKSITTCVDMQIQMQSSIKQSVAAAVAQTVEKTRCSSMKGRCCVCYATQVDSFLYRCGHMCTCFDCSLELQCRSGKCPVCEAPILDVVRMASYGYGEC